MVLGWKLEVTGIWSLIEENSISLILLKVRTPILKFIWIRDAFELLMYSNYLESYKGISYYRVSHS